MPRFRVTIMRRIEATFEMVAGDRHDAVNRANRSLDRRLIDLYESSDNHRIAVVYSDRPEDKPVAEQV